MTSALYESWLEVLLAVLPVLILGSYAYTYRTAKEIVKHQDLIDLKDALKRLEERIDKIYEILCKGGMCR